MTEPPAGCRTDPRVADATLWIVDLDGVVWLSGEAIGDAAGAVDRLRTHGRRVVFATNNSAPTTGELLARLGRIGIEATAEDLATSAAAAAGLLESGASAHVLADGGVLEALAARGVVLAADGPTDATVVGWTRRFDFATLTAAATAARGSGRLIGTNEDPFHPTPEGLLPGSGAILAAVATASGVIPQIAGKPHAPMADMLVSRFGAAGGRLRAVVVGDQPATDGRLAERLGLPFALVDSGVTASGGGTGGVEVAVRAPDLGSLVDRCLAG